MKAVAFSLLLLVASGGAISAGAPPSLAPASPAAISDIPPAYLALYQEAGTKFSVPWQVLAAIGRVESDHGRNPNAYVPNYVGAVGPMQFLPATFAEYALAAGHPDPDILDPHDAIFAAAAMLDRNGISRDFGGAIYDYNHDWGYVRLVLDWAGRYGWHQ
jgi:membrane-bound lytic murein transglycosylase B